jgi:hypothetical protein
MLILVQYSWRYLNLDVYLNITKELQYINSISDDDLLQQQKLTALSKRLLIGSSVNLALLILWFSPFIGLYFTFGKNYIYLLMSSTTFLLFSLLLSIIFFLINKNK